MAEDFDLPEGAEAVDMASTFVKWEKLGDRVIGTALRLEQSKKYGKDGFVLVMLGDDGKRFAVSAPLKLVGAVQDHNLLGHRLCIIFSDRTKTEKGEIKEFKIGKLPPLAEEMPF